MFVIIYYEFIDISGGPYCDDDLHFTCTSKKCIPKGYVCDGDYDCGTGDDSDEQDCESM